VIALDGSPFPNGSTGSAAPLRIPAAPLRATSEYYRRAGQDEAVRSVLLAKQCHQRSRLSASGREIGLLLDPTVGYRYWPWLAAIWQALLLAIGTIVYSLGDC
jgi:hypothetical protein